MKWILTCIIMLVSSSIFAQGWSEKTTSVTENLNSVYFRPQSQTGFIVGANGTLLKTTNGGDDWSSINTSLSSELNSIFFTNSTTGFFTGSSGELYRSTNGGSNWSALTSQTTQSVNDVFFYNANFGIIVADQGDLSKTNNGGLLWTKITTGVSENLNSVHIISSTIAYLAGDNGTILKSTNGGSNWTALTSGTSENLNSIYFSDINTGFVAGDNGLIMKTTNGGTTWTSQTTGTTLNINELEISSNDDLIYAVGENSIILKTTNGGTTWTSQTSPISENLNSVVVSTQNVAYAVGDNGKLITTVTGGAQSSITVDSPNGGETWLFNTSHDILWTYVGIDEVRIEYSLDNQNSWSLLATVDASDRKYTWTVPAILTSQAYVRISDESNSALFDISNNAFKLADYVLTIDSPNGGETWAIGDTEVIEWTSEDIDNVNLEYSTDGGSNWNSIVSNIAASSGTFSWAIPNAASTNALVRILNADDITENDQSDAAFVIQGPEVSIVQPNGGESWASGDVYQIQWNSVSVSEVDIYYSIDGGSNWISIAEDITASNSAYSWVVPNNPSSNARVRIESSANSSIYDESDVDFTIEGYNLDINSPNGNETWNAGSSRTIVWTANQNITTISIDYSTDNGSNWSVVESNIDASTGSYAWTIPNTPSASVLVRVRNSLGVNQDESDAVFSIEGVRIDSPSENEAITSGQSYDIEWTSTGPSLVDIAYTTDGGSNWSAIGSGINATQGQFPWSVPSINSNAVQVRVRGSSDTSLSDINDISILQANVNVVSPDTGVFWRVGTEREITWTYNFLDSIVVEYSIDAGINWIVIDTVPGSDDSYDWIIPNNLTSNAKIKLTALDNNTITDESGIFTITDEEVILRSPNGGERWMQGEVRTISWEADDATNVALDYSTDDGSSWETITASTAANTDYSWTVPAIPSDQVILRVSDADKPGLFDTTDNRFTVRGVRLTSPIGGESYLIRSQQQITWASEQVDEVNIYYSPDNGANWNTIVENWPGSGGFYSWDLPDFPSEQYLVKIIDPNNSNFTYTSDAVFTITGLYLTSPMGGEQWLMGTNQQITYESVDVDNIKIEYSTNGGDNWITVISFLDPSSGNYSWSVPETPGTNNYVRVTDLDNPSFTDTSPNSFEITGNGIQLVSPNGGEIWTSTSSRTISWASANVDEINIEYSSNNGSSWNTINNNTNASTGYFTWSVPSSYSTQYLVRVTDTQNSNITDLSDAVFTVSGGDFDLPDNWDFTSQTGLSSVIIIPSAINPQVGSGNIANGDYIGVFYNDSGERYCAGYGEWTGSNLSITVWGNNSETSIKEGFSNGEAYTFRIWDASVGVEYNATVEYASGSSSEFENNDIVILSSLKTNQDLTVSLDSEKWQFISSNLLLADSSIVNVMEDVAPSMEYMKDELALTYYPSEGINTLEEWSLRKGYQIYMNEAESLVLTGAEIDPSDYVISLIGNSWHIIPLFSRKLASNINCFEFS